ncbi:MAG: hypothetical protein COC05_04330 [Gammaproteobacteria bacterium]|nr:MAG: hypothetical protein COC05_04330 [Gammaproteobacteria bacterium]
MFESITNVLYGFHFIRPLWLLAIIPLLLLAASLLAAQLRNKRWSEVIDPDLLEHLLDTSATVKKRWPIYILGMAWMLSCVALAGPSWQKLPQPVEKKTDVMVVIVDMTLSMYATDVTPSRLLRARYKLLELLAQRREGQTALIAYSGDAHIVSPLTDDSKTIAALVPALSPEIMPTIGNNAGAAFTIAAELIGASSSQSARIVWLTDELLDKDRKPIESVLAQYTIDLVVIGVGSERGGLIKLSTGKFIKDNSGKLITAKLNRSELKQFVTAQGGHYTDLSSDNSDINTALSESLFDKSDTGSGNTSQESQRTVERWKDQGAWLLLLLIPVALFSFRRGWVLSVAFCAVLILPPETYAATWQDLWLSKDQQASKALEQGKVDEAAELFENAQWKGAANYQSGKFAESAKNLEGIDEANAHYNRGHALAHEGKLEDAIAAYDSALGLQPDMENAKKAKALIEQLLKQKQDQEQQDQEGEEDKEGEGENDGKQQGGSQSNESNEADGSGESEQSEQQSESNSDSDAAAEQQDAFQAETDTNEGEKKNPGEEAKSQAALENEAAASLSEVEQLSAQQSEALQQWLRQIPDDPAGLLRRKFQYERQLREREGAVIEPEEDGQIW